MRGVGAAAALLALAAAAAAAAADEWQGVRAADPAWCANAGHIGEAAEAPVRITAGTIDGLENRCEITDVAPTGGSPAPGASTSSAPARD